MRLHNYKNPVHDYNKLQVSRPPFAQEHRNWHTNPEKNWKKADID